MASLKIPQDALPDLKKIAEMEEGVFNSLIAVFRDTEPTLNQGQFQKAVASKAATISSDDLRDVLGTTFYFFKIKRKRGASPADLAEAVINSSVVSNSKELSAETKERLRERLRMLLALDKTLGVTAKAFDVMAAHGRIFCSVRILSDIRPVFSESSLEEASAAVIIHKLQIGFHQGREHEHEEIYFALDMDDLEKLKRAIERAEKKTIALKSILAKAGVRYLEA